MIKEINVTTGEVIEREYTEAEEKLSEKTQKEFTKAIAEAEARATQKAALLDRLGITEDEARLLLG
jgi:hypothetical protein